MTDMKKLAWLGDPGLKEQVVLRMKQHRAEDSIIQGKYQVYAPEFASQYKGCLLGCTLPLLPHVRPGQYFSAISWHMEVEKAYGIPFMVAHIMECVFESLPFDQAAQFAVDSIEAIPVGADLSKVIDYWRELGQRRMGQRVATDLLDILRDAPVPEPAQ